MMHSFVVKSYKQWKIDLCYNICTPKKEQMCTVAGTKWNLPNVPNECTL